MSVTDAPAPVRNHRPFILMLCCLIAIRIFIYSAAFPFFNNVDEQANFDLVVKYSHLNVPHTLESYSPDAAADITLYQSYAFLGQTTNRPPWELPDDDVGRLLQQTNRWTTIRNYECSQPPLYYALAGVWRRTGQAIGIQGEGSLYWIRFLNILFGVTLVCLAYRTARLLFPENIFLTLGVPALTACLPQTIFFAINNDMLSALSFGVAFFCLVKWLVAPSPAFRPSIATGLSFAAVFLTKMTNLPLLAVAGIAILFKVRELARQKRLRDAIPALAALTIAAAAPAGLWMAWCQVHFGDLTGTEIKAEHFGWVHRPVAEWWHHPIFGPAGFWKFLSTLLATFWQGEFYWHREAMPSTLIGKIYAILSLVALAWAGTMIGARATLSSMQSRALRLSFAGCVGAILFWGWLSTTYEFGEFVYPSRELPYFLSGRLILGALIPFLLLVAWMLDRALAARTLRVKTVVLGALLLFMLTTELLMNFPAFANPYNWFHL